MQQKNRWENLPNSTNISKADCQNENFCTITPSRAIS